MVAVVMLRRTRDLNERRVSFRGGRECSQCCVSTTGGAEGKLSAWKVVGEGESSAVKLGPAGGGLREGVEWARGRPVKLLAGGNREAVECKSRVEALR